MINTSKDGDKWKWVATTSASVKREKVVGNPPKKLSRKRAAYPEISETTKGVENAHLELENHEGKTGRVEHH
jgi:hypothetical protein